MSDSGIKSKSLQSTPAKDSKTVSIATSADQTKHSVAESGASHCSQVSSMGSKTQKLEGSPRGLATSTYTLLGEDRGPSVRLDRLEPMPLTEFSSTTA